MYRNLLSLFFLHFLCFPLFAQSIDLVPYATGLSAPTDIVHAGGSELFVVERAGRIRIINSGGSVDPTPFLDITGRVLSNTGERGLLGIAFHPEYPDSAYVYCNYTGTGGATFVSRFDVVSSTLADSTTEKMMLTFSQPFTNHNGGDLDFDDDGYLLISSGDGGSGGDPQDNGQDLTTLLGKILRIDVDTTGPYAIPDDNPFVGVSGVREEIYAYGLRNPWRIDYDPMTSSLYIGDVGQNAFEEVSVLVDNTTDPNFGWRCYEAWHPYNLTDCGGVDTIAPVYEYPHNAGAGCTASITGGKVYRGTGLSGFEGKYFFADYCNGWIGTLDPVNGFAQDTVYDPSGLRFTAFGENVQGELFVAATNGTIYQLSGAMPTAFVFTIQLDGTQSGTGSPATGYGVAVYDSTTNVLNVSGQFTELVGNVTVAHVHRAPAGSNGGVVFALSLADYGTDSLGFFGSGTLGIGQESDLLGNDGLYVNIHSNVNPGGEIRGQIIRTDCPSNYLLKAPLLPMGTFPVTSSTLNGKLTNDRNLIIEYQDEAELLKGFEVNLGATFEILQDNCP